jgi:glycolate oxidase iron-sulfur subunit
MMRESAERANTPQRSAHNPDTLKEDIERCAKCGQCRTVCPVFLETNVEMMVARGRISLAQAVLEGRAAYSRRMEEYIQSCLKCLRCGANCPSGVPYERILQEVRLAMGRDLGVPLLARLIFRLILPHRWVFDLAIRSARIGQWLVPLKREGHMRHLPLFFAGRRWVPSLASRSALRRLRDLQPLPQPKLRVTLFLGCLINYVYPEIADATVSVLRRLGVEVIVPRGQGCCSTPVLSFGDEASARKLAERNLGELLAASPDYIVTACASCGKTLRSEYERLGVVGAEAFGPKVLDISELLDKVSLPALRPLRRKVTYHDPCHLRWGQGVIKQPRALLEQSAAYVEMSEAERCCGGGGSFSLFHYDLAVKIASHKVQAIAESGAETVATNCPGCILHISDRLTAEGRRVPVVHTIQVVEEAMRQEEKGENG